jgi:hypothetical protein
MLSIPPKYIDGIPRNATPINNPPSKENPRPIDLNTGKYLDQEGYNKTDVDYPYVQG